MLLVTNNKPSPIAKYKLLGETAIFFSGKHCSLFTAGTKQGKNLCTIAKKPWVAELSASWFSKTSYVVLGAYPHQGFN